MKSVCLKAAVIASTAALAGCMSDDYLREEGLTAGAGDAIAANTVMQMVDPWPNGVQHTDVRTPSDLGQYRRGQAQASGATSQSDSTVAGTKP